MKENYKPKDMKVYAVSYKGKSEFCNIPDANNQITIAINEDKGKKEASKFNLLSLCSIFGSSSNVSNEPISDNTSLSKEVDIKEHLMTLEELAAKFNTDLEKGISRAVAEFRLICDGTNSLTPPKQTSNWLLFVWQLVDGFAWLMWLSVVASVVAYFMEGNREHYILAIMLAFVVITTALYSFSQQRNSNQMFNTFKNMIPQSTIVIRDGQPLMISSERLVVGDLVQCRGGERIPADVRLLTCEGMKVDHSSLTGECEPVWRWPESGHHSPLNAANLAFFSTTCVEGHGLGLVIATGDATVMGKVARLVTAHTHNRQSPIGVQLNRLAVFIAAMAIAEGAIFLAVCLGLRMDPLEAGIFTIGLIVGNIPEGLLPALSLSLTLTAKRMATKHCVIKHLDAVETLGSISTICSDKTGTLTENRMTVQHVYLASQIVSVSHESDEVHQDLSHLAPECWQCWQRVANLCSRAFFVDSASVADSSGRQCSGDASEVAILHFMESVSPSVSQYRHQYPKVAEKPFSSVYKYQYSVHRNQKVNPEDPDYFLVMKGAPERIIKLCSSVLNEDGETVPLTEDDIEEFEFAYRELGSMGERVLAFCDMELNGFAPDHQFNLNEDTDFKLQNLRFVGLVSMIDPPRASVPEAVAKCKGAGINVIMVTGDHPITAQAIAKSVGILTFSHRRSTVISLPTIDRKIARRKMASIIIPGDELTALTDTELKDILRDYREIVFARTSPQQKLRIVENCQAIGKIVAVTGDGVNDSPALKKADVGVAMGITGSDVAKQAADIILMDDNFTSIVVGIEEGRKIFDNMKKTVSYIMAGNCSTLYPFVVFLAFGFPVSIRPVMILCICLGTDLMPAISLAFEKAESDTMKLSPRDPNADRLVTRNLLLWSVFQGGVIVTSSGYLGFFVCLMQNGFMPWHLWQVRHQWTDPKEVFTDMNGNHVSADARAEILKTAQTAYFVSIVVVQLMDVIVNKTRRMSIFHQGFENWLLNFSLVVEIIIAVGLVYIPSLNTALTFTPVSYTAWLCGVPFFFYFLAYEEIRKLIIRKYSKSFLGKELAT